MYHKGKGCNPMEKGKVVMITGASKGFGRALAKAYAEQGAKLALCARKEAPLQALKEELQALSAEVSAKTADVSVSADVERFVSITETGFGDVNMII